LSDGVRCAFFGGMSQPTPAPPRRLGSVDAYRGVVMFLMLAEVLRFCAVSAAIPGSAFWRFLCHQQSHVEWVGCSLHDLIQPSFSFLVGVVVPFSLASRRARGQTIGAMTQHAVLRALLLIFLGVALHRMRWEFIDTLTQIGLGYVSCSCWGLRPVREQWIAAGLILGGCWLAFALWPLPGPGFDYGSVGVSADWLKEHGLKGFEAHWQKNSNPASAFDVWFLNLFPRSEVHIGQPKGLTTLNFIPLLATMILGLIAGNVLRSDLAPWPKVRRLAILGVVTLGAGSALGALRVCPIVKSVWTPSWVLFSGGWCFLFLAAFYAMVDIAGQKKPVFPFVVLGTNSLTAYCIALLYPAFAFNSLKRIVGDEVFRLLGDAYEPAVYGSVVLVGYWVFLFVLHHRKIFLRI